MVPREQITVVLVRPRNPLNIGAVARAMANFGFSRLTVVAPYEPHWREARSAVGAPDLLCNAKETATLTEAVAKCTLVAGTGTLEHRRPEQRIVSLPDLAPLIREEVLRGGRIALVFGPEKHGLTRDDLACCHLFVKIPTDPRQPSMNLGQAVAVCLYELAVRGPIEAKPQALAPAEPAASSGALDLLAEVVEETMDASGYSPTAMRKANRRDLEALLRRLTFTDRDAQRSLRLFRRVLWRLRRQNPNASDTAPDPESKSGSG